jgi:hypothetical protein
MLGAEKAPEPSNCPLCGSKCENAEDGDSYAIVCCTRVDAGGHTCPYHVYQECHEALCAKVREAKA